MSNSQVELKNLNLVGEMRPNGLGSRDEDVERQDQGKSQDTNVGDEEKESGPSSMHQQVWDSIKKQKPWDLIQASSLVSLTGLLIATLVINKLENSEIWDVELWRTCVFVMVIFCGNVISRGLKNGVTFLIVKSNHYLKSKFVYLIYVIVGSSTIFIWLGLVMVVWLVLIRGRLERSFSSEDEQKVLRKISRAMVATLVGLSLWYLKTYVIKLIDSSFKMKKFFVRVQDAIIYKFVVQELEIYRTGNTVKILEWDYVEKLSKSVQGEVTSIYMAQLIEKLSVSELIESTRAESEQKSKDDVDKIMRKIQHQSHSHDKSSPRYVVHKGKLKEALKEAANEKRLSIFLGDEIEIDASDFRAWMIEADKELRNLAGSLQDSKTAIDELNIISGVLVGIGIMIVWSLVMGILTTEAVVFVSSQLLVWSFIFSDTFKTVFEGIIFNFVAHPLDVGDECIIEDKKMVVEEMGLLSTNFQANKKKGNENVNVTKVEGEPTCIIEEKEQKIHYSNSVLAGMRIINLSQTSCKNEVSRIWTWNKKNDLVISG